MDRWRDEIFLKYQLQEEGMELEMDFVSCSID